MGYSSSFFDFRIRGLWIHHRDDPPSGMFSLRHDQIPSAAGEKNHSCHEEKRQGWLLQYQWVDLVKGKSTVETVRWRPQTILQQPLASRKEFMKLCAWTPRIFRSFSFTCDFKVWVYEITNKTQGWILQTLAYPGSAIQDGKIWMFQLPFLGHVQHWGPQEVGRPQQKIFQRFHLYASFTNIFTLNIPNQLDTWWLIPLSKWVITPVIGGLTLLIPFITGVITHLLSGIFQKSPATLWSCRVHHGWDASQPFPDFELFLGSWYPKW